MSHSRVCFDCGPDVTFETTPYMVVRVHRYNKEVTAYEAKCVAEKLSAQFPDDDSYVVAGFALKWVISHFSGYTPEQVLEAYRHFRDHRHEKETEL